MSARHSGPFTDQDALAEDLYADRVRLLYRNLPISQLAVAINGTVLALIQTRVIATSVIAVWLGAVIVLALARTWLYRSFHRRHRASHAILPWSRALLAGTLASGVLWGAAAWLLFPESQIEHQFAVVFVLAGMSAGAVTTLSAMRSAALAFLLPTMVLLILRLATLDNAMALPMAGMSALFLLMVSVAAWRGRAVVMDTLELRYAHRQALEDLRLAATAFQSQEGIQVLAEDGTVLRANIAMSAITGYSIEALIGTRSRHVEGDQARAEIATALRRSGCWRGEVWEQRKNGEYYPAWLTITAVRNDSGEVTHYVEHLQDITERKQAEARIAFQARYDALTELPNRRLLMERLAQDLSRCQRFGRLGGLLFIDLDRFKTINDSLGHSIGDAMLKEVANRLRTGVRREDTAARFGGDEFVVVLTELGTTLEEAADKAGSAAAKLIESLSRPYVVGQNTLHTTCSIGVALYPLDEHESAEDVLKHADAALYHSKDDGRNDFSFYSPRMSEAAESRLRIESDLRSALDAEQFTLALQPKVDADGRTVGAEALLRWTHPLLGPVPPDQFIPIAEETGLILDIGTWVLDAACAEFTTWPRLAGPAAGLSIAVNVSPREFYQADFVQRVLGVLRKHDMDPRCLELELTEGMLVNNINDAAAKMTALSASGVRVAIDDFGTGYSSLAYLKRLPLHTLKIDQSFVRDVTEDESSAAITQAIIAVAHHLGLDVIAEGVETEGQARFLQRHGCYVYQGYHFSRPLSREAFRTRITSALN